MSNYANFKKLSAGKVPKPEQSEDDAVEEGLGDAE